MQLFYYPQADINTQHIVFDKEESKHIVKVLRFSQGHVLWVTNGKGLLFQTRITDAHQKHCTVQVIAVEEKPQPTSQLHIAIAPTKMNERYEWFLEKATEFGVQQITPIICEHSERKVINHERFEKIILSAMKQSLQCYLPKLNQAVSLFDFLKEPPEGRAYIAYCRDERVEFHHLYRTQQPQVLVVLIGPEGDFSDKEVAQAFQKGYQAVALGGNRLRTETAGVAVSSIVAFN